MKTIALIVWAVIGAWFGGVIGVVIAIGLYLTVAKMILPAFEAFFENYESR